MAVLTAAPDEALPLPELAMALVSEFRAEMAEALAGELALDFDTTAPAGNTVNAVPLAGPPAVLT